MNDERLIDVIDGLLPQTQCQECEFSACRPYAEAMVNKHASIDKCKPGGTDTLMNLAQALDVDPNPYLQTVIDQFRPASVVRIDLNVCIGCVKCIQACPVDAICGSAKHAHVVLEDVCTGCNLCIEPCPVDCIEVVPLEDKSVGDRNIARQSKERFLRRNLRLETKQSSKKLAFAKAKQLVSEEFL